MTWYTTNMIATGGGLVDPAAAPTTLRAFHAWAPVATLHVEDGGSVDLQRQDESGAWETFETVSGPEGYEIAVANHPAIRIAPVSSARYLWTWSV